MVPHIGRHLEQAERIKGGRLAKEAQVENPDLIFPTRSRRVRVNSAGKTG